jgi:hypothetical protein
VTEENRAELDTSLEQMQDLWLESSFEAERNHSETERWAEMVVQGKSRNVCMHGDTVFNGHAGRLPAAGCSILAEKDTGVF